MNSEKLTVSMIHLELLAKEVDIQILPINNQEQRSKGDGKNT